MKKYSTGFNETFIFFLKSYRKEILDFCGQKVTINFSLKEKNAKELFMNFENGKISSASRHNNVLHAVIVDKKAWGLWVKEWTDGIVEGSFSEKEILQEFSLKGISVPEKFLKEFDNLLMKKRLKYNKK